MPTMTTDAAIKIPQAALREALAAVKPAVPTRAIKPIYSNVVLRDGVLSAGGGDLWIDYTLRLEEPQRGGEPLVLPFARLQAIVSSVSADAVVTFTPAGPAVKIKAARGAWTLPTEDPAAFAVPADVQRHLRPAGRIPPDQFRRAVAATAFAADQASGRAAMGGVLLDQKDGRLHFVATDGRRMAVAVIEIGEAVDDSATIVPVPALDAAADMPGDAAIGLEVSSSWVVFSGEGWTVSTPVVSGTFPKWRPVVPKSLPASTATAVRGELLAGFKAAAICEDEVSRGVVVSLSGGVLTLTAKSSAAGSSRVTVPLADPRPEPIKVKLDPRYVTEWLRGLPGEDACPTVEIQATSPDSAVVFRCDDATNVVMPLQKGDADDDA